MQSDFRNVLCFGVFAWMVLKNLILCLFNRNMCNCLQQCHTILYQMLYLHVHTCTHTCNCFFNLTKMITFIYSYIVPGFSNFYFSYSGLTKIILGLLKGF